MCIQRLYVFVSSIGSLINSCMIDIKEYAWLLGQIQLDFLCIRVLSSGMMGYYLGDELTNFEKFLGCSI